MALCWLGTQSPVLLVALALKLVGCGHLNMPLSSESRSVRQNKELLVYFTDSTQRSSWLALVTLGGNKFNEMWNANILNRWKEGQENFYFLVSSEIQSISIHGSAQSVKAWWCLTNLLLDQVEKLYCYCWSESTTILGLNKKYNWKRIKRKTKINTKRITWKCPNDFDIIVNVNGLFHFILHL